MRHPPHRFERGWIICEAGDEMPVNVWELVAQQFVVDFSWFVDLVQDFGNQGHFLYQLHPLGRCQVKELGRMPAKDQYGPAGKELIVMEIGPGQPEVGDEVVGSRPGARTCFAQGIVHARSIAKFDRLSEWPLALSP